jgi:peptide deformylase
MALRIRKYPDPILRRRAQEIEAIDDEVKRLADAMVETMILAKGYGLAAPQVGILKRLITIDVEDDFYALINPEIIHKSEDSAIWVEGCLSIPGVEAEFMRPARVTVRALDQDGNELLLDRDELIARVLQHEIDHLNGMLFIDHLSQTKRLMLLKEYERLQKQGVKARKPEGAKVF